MKPRAKEINRDKEIKLYNKLAEAKYAMSLSEQKLFLYAVRNIDQDAKEFPESKIKLLEFAHYADLDIKQLYKDIEKMSTRLMQVVIHVEDHESGGNKWEKYNLTKKCDYNNGVIMFAFNDDMKPFLLGLQKHYFKQAPEIMGFRSWYSFRLYDLLKSQLYKNKDITINVEWLKSILGVEYKYKNFTNFKLRVLEPAIKEINKYSDINLISYITIKQGKTISEIVFEAQAESISTKEYSDMLRGMYDTEEFKRRIGLTPRALTDIQIIELYEITTIVFTDYRDMDDLYEYMRLNYEYTKERVLQSNRYPYFKKALQNDYAHAISQIMTGHYID